MSIQSHQDQSVPSHPSTLPTGALRWAILLLLFDGDAAAWAAHVAAEGSASQLRDDLPIALSVANLCTHDESLRRRLRALGRSVQASSL